MSDSLFQDLPGPALLIAGTVLLLVVAGLTWWWRRRLTASSVPARLQAASDGLLTGVLIPNADGGQIHVDYAVRTRLGVVVVDVREVAGNIFGSETMHDWTVLTGRQRFTFANPLPVLYDRVAAVKRLLPDVPVRGVVAFMPKAVFSKGFPPNVVMFERLLEELQGARAAKDTVAADVLQAGWDRLRDEAVAVQVGRLLAD